MRIEMPEQSKAWRRGGLTSGFSLVELLVVIGIIAVLVAILVPVVASVRQAGYSTDTAALIRAVDNACRTYYQDFQEYPGALPEGMLGAGTPVDANGNTIQIASSGGVYANAGDDLANVTGTENLVLSLMGGLVSTAGGTSGGTTLVYDPAAVGRGPVSLRPGQGKAYSPYFEANADNLSWRTTADGRTGRFASLDGQLPANDSPIPEFVDGFTNPLPILYLRANTRVGRNPAIAGYTGTSAVYYLDQIGGYTLQPNGYFIGEGREPVNTEHENAGTPHGLQAAGDPTVTVHDGPGPYDAIPYLTDPNGSGARQADSYVLISAGPDRVYGTRDDITSFGEVVP